MISSHKGFIPLAVASNLFSMQGVLPFDPSLGRFTFVFVILVFLVIAPLVVHFNWESYLQPILRTCYDGSAHLVLHSKRLAEEGAARVRVARQRNMTMDIEAQVGTELNDRH
jgi:hypothetical protein